jgi:flagellar basal-body rod protein FlgF
VLVVFNPLTASAPINPITTQGYAGIDGLFASTRSMAAELKVMETHSQNIANFGIPGYQAKEPIRRQFIEHLGVFSIDEHTNTEVGRLRQTGYRGDLALTQPGYFKVLDPATKQVQLTRDGRTQVDKEGYLRLVDGRFLLNSQGSPLQFKTIPTNFEKQVKIDANGLVSYLNQASGQQQAVGKLAIAPDPSHPLAEKPQVAQGVVEDSNVMLAKEFTAMVPVRREFEANRQFFLLQSDALSRMIQELGKAQ